MPTVKTNIMHVELLCFRCFNNICLHKNVQTPSNSKLSLLNEQETLYSFLFCKKLQNKVDCVLLIPDLLHWTAITSGQRRCTAVVNTETSISDSARTWSGVGYNQVPLHSQCGYTWVPLLPTDEHKRNIWGGERGELSVEVKLTHNWTNSICADRCRDTVHVL
jgi:hypothetical protein